MRLFPVASAQFVAREWRFLAFGMLLAFWSSPGQTYVISLFGTEIRTAFNLSHGGWGALYMYATVASAVLLLFAGRLVDRYSVATMAYGGIAALALAALCFPLAIGPVTLFLGFLGLRFAGQGMMSHISATALSRHYDRERGRAVAIGALGFSAGTAVFPSLVVFLLGHYDWRHIWIGFGVVALVTTVPAIPFLLRTVRQPKAPEALDPPDRPTEPERHHWSVAQVLRDPRFYLLAPAMIGQSALGTALTFHQVHLVAMKGWTIAAWSAGYSVYAVAAIVANLTAGVLIDRYSARALTPFAVLPMAAAFLAFAGFDTVAAAALVLGLSAVAGAALNAGLTVLWVELYGTRHLGAVRSLSVFLRVFGSAIGPMAFGVALDQGAGVGVLMVVSAILVVASSVAAYFGLYGPLGRGLRPPLP
jgi:predicted MFS family arabinose efflux permease